ncbi:hypothetical protein I6F21_29795 [Bradyrhizobium sp. NBAIM03]|uniref:hypothetical protein n=1 Tax=Bradyrhizobium sp. NBAIM03 TaxID=2793816 RepID=UPI001CD4C799|nr:hypothetical protein [Bradyrhizobium sp. NBAIM03]MCA1536723.1 hypothetical protein [Bradyrhizobium sp. NBAIM03]
MINLSSTPQGAPAAPPPAKGIEQPTAPLSEPNLRLVLQVIEGDYSSFDNCGDPIALLLHVRH